MLAPKRERGGCAFRKSCRDRCLHEIKHARTDSRTMGELRDAIEWRLRRLDSLLQNGDHESLEKRERGAERLEELVSGSAIMAGDGGETSRSLCGSASIIQTYSIDEMRGVLAGLPMEVNAGRAFVASMRPDLPTGLSGNFAGLLAWIAALNADDITHMDNIMRMGGLNGMRIMARIAGEPAIDEPARAAFMDALCKISSSMIIDGEGVQAADKTLAQYLARFSTSEAYLPNRDGVLVKREYSGLRCPPPEVNPKPHMMRQMARASIEAIFQAVINISNRMDSIINSGEEELEINSARLRGMYASLKTGLRFLLDGKAVDARTMEYFADGKIIQLYGDAPLMDRGVGMDPGEQGIAKYAVSRLLLETCLDQGGMEQFYRILPASEECQKETAEKMDRFLSA